MPLFFASDETPLITALLSVPSLSSIASRRFSRGDGMRRLSRFPSFVAACFGALVVLAAYVPAARAAPSACPAFFVAGQAPDVLRMEQVSRSHMLCFRFYSTMASGITRTPLWSAERLTRDSVAASQAQKRHDAFHTEMAVVADDRAELADYRGAGFDRGHMSPSADMPDAAAQEESFSLANMVPQDAENNRHLWQGIEISTRAMAKSSGELYVVSGPAFIGTPTWVHSRVAVPSYLWKAIYDPKRGAAAYLTANRDGDAYAVVSIAMLQRITGIDPFPGLSEDVKAQAISLQPPRPSGQRMKTGPVTPAALGLVFPADGGAAQTTLSPPQPNGKLAQREARSEAAPASSTPSATQAALAAAAVAAVVHPRHRADTPRAHRAEKRRARQAAKQAESARSSAPSAAHRAATPSAAAPVKPAQAPRQEGVYGFGYQLGKTLKRLGSDIGGQGK
ncbi:DNA/RNA non-specific endonuclease [Robbsia sp. KACC 23696]|uniref:DNA/RNA non-specific endonuclease n=1 Tax=Robbsia sp. KACC 23696 TaxID=3149231 RepID=UPI00325B95CA